MVPSRIQVAMGEGLVAGAPHVVLSSGLGSCVAVILYDVQQRIGGLAHITLPDSSQLQNAKRRIRNAERGMNSPQSATCTEPGRSVPNPHPKIRTPRSAFQCADTAVAALLEQLWSRGAHRRDIVAKMVGGARMFSCYENPDTGIGKQNIASVRHILRRERIALIAEDTGGHHGRNVEFRLDSGRVIVTAFGKEDREV